jgi:signal transduction histidine kinase
MLTAPRAQREDHAGLLVASFHGFGYPRNLGGRRISAQTPSVMSATTPLPSLGPLGQDFALPRGGAPLSLDARILRGQVNSLYATGVSASVAAFLVSLGLWVIIFWQTGHRGALVWAVVLHATQLIRYLGTRRYLATPPEQRDELHAGNWFCNLLVVNGVAWGLAPWLFFPHGNLPMTTLLMVVLLGMSSGGIASLAPYRRAIFSFAVPILLGLASAMLWQRDATLGYLAFCTLIYLWVTLKFGLQQHNLLTESMRTRFEKEDLAQRLAEQVRLVERASLEKTRFFASASHDLRQPLHSLGLFGAALLSRLKTTPDEPIARNLMHCVDALETSFSSMLDVSKLDAGVVQPKPAPMSAADLFRNLDTSFARQAEALGLALRFKPGQKWLHCDAALLERLVGNLIHNALKFTESGGVVVLARSRADAVSVEVWDTGPGIAPPDLLRVFDEFYQVGNQERDRSKGLGMGLAIVRRLAQLMDLPLEVQSRVGRGTVFKLLVPAGTRQAQQTARTLSGMTGAGFRALASMQVLVIDDEENVRVSTAAALAQYGLQVALADGRAQALDIARSLGPKLDAVISDFRLRDNDDGISVVAALRQALGRHVAALLVTGDTAPERVRQAQHSGLRVLYKPVKIDALVQELRALIGPR